MKPTGHAATILELFRAAEGREVSSAEICARLAISRAAVWKQIERLRGEGYAIEAATRRGYRLAAEPDTPSPEGLSPFLTTTRFGRTGLFAPTMPSTNRLLAERCAEPDLMEGYCVAAGTQTAGRGRQARVWFSPPDRNLYVSLLLRPDVQPSEAVTLPLLVGLAVAETVEALVPGCRAQVKWPNDIWIDGRKVCGVLCEMQIEAQGDLAVIAGIGLNVNLRADEFPAELVARATSLAAASAAHGGPERFSRARVLAELLNRFEPAYDRWLREGFAAFASAFAARDALMDRPIRIDQGGRLFEGRAAGVNPDGTLRLLQPDGTLAAIHSGEAHLLAGK